MSHDTTGKAPEDRTILINFVLDRSGSMQSIAEATISGFNEFLQSQRNEAGTAVMNLTLFDTRMDVVARAVPLSEMVSLDMEAYRPDGCTALLDAIGYTMEITDDYVANMTPDQVVFVIMTDGLENASQTFRPDQIRTMIHDRTNLGGYEFIYLGANQDAWEVGHSMGIAGSRSLTYAHDSESARDTVGRVSRNVAQYRHEGHRVMQDDEWFSEEYERRGGMTPEHRLEYERTHGPRERGGTPSTDASQDDSASSAV